MSGGPRATSAVWGRDDLTCPVARPVIRRMVRYAKANPWPGNVPLMDPRHLLDTTAITEPGRLTRIMCSLDVGYHASGWFANSDFESCLHLSVSHPRAEQTRLYVPKDGFPGGAGMDLDVPTDEEVRAWGRVFYGEHCTMAWFEPAASVFDTYRMPGIVHLRLYIDRDGNPFQPTGEVYTLRPWADGSSPAKITEGRLGADIR